MRESISLSDYKGPIISRLVEEKQLAKWLKQAANSHQPMDLNITGEPATGKTMFLKSELSKAVGVRYVWCNTFELTPVKRVNFALF